MLFGIFFTILIKAKIQLILNKYKDKPLDCTPNDIYDNHHIILYGCLLA